MSKTLYRKNIRQWGQWSRVVAGAAMLIAAVAVASLVARVLLGTGGAIMVATGLVGWCPACAMVGRTLDQKAGRVSP